MQHDVDVDHLRKAPRPGILLEMLAFYLCIAAVLMANVIAWRTGKLAPVAVLMAGIMVAVWLFSASTEGFMDCWPECTAKQEFAVTAFFFLPLGILIEFAVSFVAYMRRGM